MGIGPGRGARVLLASALLAGAALLPQPTEAYHGCNGTPHCPAYTRVCGQAWGWCPWPANDKGIAHIHFWVNPHNQSWLTEKEAVGASRWAARAWERANPKIRLHYHGTTRDLPYWGDNKLVVGWVPLVNAAAEASLTAPDADIRLNIKNPWVWKPCRWSCPDFNYEEDAIWIHNIAYGAIEAQSIITHEFGHILGLDHPLSSHGDTCALTMHWDSGGCHDQDANFAARNKSTLGLGDILGAKKLYPWECPSPKKAVSGRKAYPKRWRHICPTIKVYTP